LNFFSLALTVEALQGKTCQDSRLSGEYVTWSQYFRGEGVVPGEYFLVYKTRHILLSDSVNFMVLRAVVFTQYRRVTAGQTDGRNCRS